MRPHVRDMKLLTVITGPTASGKTALAVELARHLGCEIISADSRQVYRDMAVGTAVPTAAELQGVAYHNIARLPLDSYYSAACFEQDTLRLLDTLWSRSDHAILCGGSMMYVDAVTRGIDEIPTVSDEIRADVLARYRARGLDAMLDELRSLDPEYAGIVDVRNPKRVIHAIEICLQAGRPYSELRTGQAKERPWQTLMMVIDYPRDILFSRINARVDAMVRDGLVDEARRLYPQRHLNALNTVGYKELFAAFDGTMPLPTAIERIKKNTRVYAKKQLTWMQRYTDIHRLTPANAVAEAIDLIHSIRQTTT